MKHLIKKVVYESGLLSIFHHYRNKHTLTILMLHRVLPEETMMQTGADLEWTITPEILDRILLFAKRYYNIITLNQLELYQDEPVENPLPNRALLLTFDDGWKDNYQFALPILKKYRVSAVLHQVTDCIDNQMLLWQEQLAILFNTNLSAFKQLSIKYLGRETSLQNFVDEFSCIEDRLDELSMDLIKMNPLANQMMLSREQIVEMISSSFALSSHGKTHRKLSTLSDQEVEQELSLSMAALTELANLPVTSISFPHGNVNRSILKLSRANGYKTLFTSRPVINDIKTNSRVWGRVHLSSALVSNDNGFCDQKLAYLLFNRTISRGF